MLTSKSPQASHPQPPDSTDWQDRIPLRAAPVNGVEECAPPSISTAARTAFIRPPGPLQAATGEPGRESAFDPTSAAPLDSSQPSSWRHLQIDAPDTTSELAQEGWVYDHVPAGSPEGPIEPTRVGPASSRRPLSSWSPRQSYSSYLPPSEEAALGKVYALKVLDTTSELIQSYRLRYEVFAELGYLQQENHALLEIDAYDAYAIPFGAISLETRELMGTMRLITPSVQPFYQARIRRILDFCADPSLTARVQRARPRLLPSLSSSLIEDMLDAYNTRRRPVHEISRYIVHPSRRRSCLARGLLEFIIAYAKASEDPLLLASCIPSHVPMNARFGFERLPGTDLSLSDHVGQIANTIVCDTRRLPEPAASRVTSIVDAMRAGEPECLIDGRDAQIGAQSVYHFGDHVVVARPSHVEFRYESRQEITG